MFNPQNVIELHRNDQWKHISGKNGKCEHLTVTHSVT